MNIVQSIFVLLVSVVCVNNHYPPDKYAPQRRRNNNHLPSLLPQNPTGTGADCAGDMIGNHLSRLRRHLRLHHKSSRRRMITSRRQIDENLGKSINRITLLTLAENFSAPLHVTWHGNAYIPYNYRCHTANFCRPGTRLPAADRHEIAQTIEAITTDAHASNCALMRWNYELPFTEFPNMVAGLLAFDMISGYTSVAKTRFFLAVLKLGLESYMVGNSSAEIFTLPANFHMDDCKIRRTIEPTMKSLYELLNLYSARQTGSRLLFTLVKAAKACLDKHDEPFPLELLPCLDFSFGLHQVSTLRRQQSLFGNLENCRNYLRRNISKCVPDMEPAHSCTEEHLLTLNNFARKFYQCPGTLTGGHGELSTDQTDTDSAESSEYYVDLETGSDSQRSTSVTYDSVGLFCWTGYLAVLLAQTVYLLD